MFLTEDQQIFSQTSVIHYNTDFLDLLSLSFVTSVNYVGVVSRAHEQDFL